MRSIVFGVLLSAMLAISAGAQPEQRFESGTGKVALIELYTSEGCSSCPPAEHWLSGLRQDPGLWKAFVPVAFHVTYWDKLGWKDQFARDVFTARQYAYAKLWGSESVYTPCFVHDGAEWRSRTRPGDPRENAGALTVVVVGASGQLDIHYAPLTAKDDSLEVWSAVLSTDVDSIVKRGENAGRKLRHDFTVMELASAPLQPGADSRDLVASLQLREASRPVPDIRAVAAWVTVGNKPGRVLQAAGGWLSATAK